jgi:hypothetical protein
MNLTQVSIVFTDEMFSERRFQAAESSYNGALASLLRTMISFAVHLRLTVPLLIALSTLASLLSLREHYESLRARIIPKGALQPRAHHSSLPAGISTLSLQEPQILAPRDPQHPSSSFRGMNELLQYGCTHSPRSPTPATEHDLPLCITTKLPSCNRLSLYTAIERTSLFQQIYLPPVSRH